MPRYTASKHVAPRVDQRNPTPTTNTRSRMCEIATLVSIHTSVAILSGNTQYPSTHTLWKNDLNRHITKINVQYVRQCHITHHKVSTSTYMELPSNCALTVTIAAPIQITTKTPVNTIADWAAGAVTLSILHTKKTNIRA